MSDYQGYALMAERYAEEKAEEQRSRDPRLAFLHSVSNIMLWLFFASSILAFVVGCVYGIVLLIKRLL